MKKNFTIGEAIGWGFRTFFDNIGLFLAILVVYFCIILGLGFLKLLGTSKLVTTLISIIVYLVLAGFYIGYTKLRLDLYEGKKPSVDVLFGSYRLLPRIVLASIVFGLMVGIGFLLLIIPGIYLALRYGFFYYAMVDKNVNIQESFDQSTKLTKGIKFELLTLYIVCGIISIIPIFMPAAGLAIVYAYKKQQAIVE